MTNSTDNQTSNGPGSSKYFGWLGAGAQDEHKYDLVEDEETGLMDKMQNAAGGAWESAKGVYDDYTISTTTWIQFFCLLAAGCFFLFLSSISLTMMGFTKFAQLFTIGSICILAAFVVLRGAEKFWLHCTATQTNKYIAATYAASLLLTFWFTVFYTSFVMVIVLVVIQLIALLYFLFSYIPGGKAFLDYIFGGCFRACCGKK